MRNGSDTANRAGGRPRALIIGARGVLGTLVAAELDAQGWATRRGSRRPDAASDRVLVDLGRPETVRAAIQDVDVVVNTVPDVALVAERAVLELGGTLLNVSALPAACATELQRDATSPRGMVVMNAGIAPGLTNLVAADLVDRFPHTDEVEMIFTVSTKASTGSAGGAFGHRNLTGVGRHRTRVVPLPAPYGRRRVLGFAEAEHGWLSPDATRAVHTYLCVAERSVQRALLSLNAAGAIKLVPRAAFRPVPLRDDHVASAELVTHWVAVLDHGQRVAVRTIETDGDYAAAASVTAAMAEVLVAPHRARPGVVAPEAVFALHELVPRLEQHGVHVVARDAAGVRCAGDEQLAEVAPAPSVTPVRGVAS